MANRCILKAPAKINLHLQIGAKREDGFHDIISVFQMVDLYDKITMRSLKTDNDCRIYGNFDCKIENNLIYKAWKEYCQKAGKVFGVDFFVKKNISVFAGLGGGSSDAASALKAMNYVFSCFNKKELMEIASKVGSDVTFFLSDSPAALVEGRGEKITPIEYPKNYRVILLIPPVKVVTASAYSWIDQSPKKKDDFFLKKRILDVYNGKPGNYRFFKNDFADLLQERFAVFSRLKFLLKKYGSFYCNVTGSGSAVFGLFENAKQAEEAIKMLKKEKISLEYLNLLDRLPNDRLK